MGGQVRLEPKLPNVASKKKTQKSQNCQVNV